MKLTDRVYVLKKTSSDGGAETYNTIFGKVNICFSALDIKRSILKEIYFHFHV